ncbi:MAG: flagellar type III secretion system protein FlhB [Betaproteobacteria bacterium]|nr:flagellar type III secretion system protein FlhB [Betaproteobacteria bacterium]MBK7743967.1 flagellar type III secretion system protein FlhB [Betaproteobacteria bacterium]MBK9676496.1 flagellar type III secretion system protein FlhB [Betaproteobacteria bacterium]
MAEEQDAERTFQPTPKRLEQAREKGQIPRSRELATAAVALSGAMALWWMGPELYRRCLGVFRSGLAFDRAHAVEPDRMLAGLSGLSVDMLLAISPLLAMVLVATLGAPLLLSGWVWSGTAFAPDFARLSPARGLGNMFSSQSLVELGKAIAKCLLLGGIGYWALSSSWAELQQLPARDTGGAVARVGVLVSTGFFALVGGLVVVALIDVPWQIWHYHDQLKMTRQEVVQEQREMEGDPQLKARIRSQQREVARRRMMSAVPTADVIVTNPTHYAVALQYRDGSMRAPQVVAKGMNLIAQRIREIGAEHGVTVLEAPPLARALYRHAEIGSEIPPALYTVVAQVLAYVFQVERQRSAGGPAPAIPSDLAVPPELDPLQAAGYRPEGAA